MEERAGIYDFASIGELAETTTQLLALDLQRGTAAIAADKRGAGDQQVKQFVLQKARDYLSEVREGFMLSVRTGQATDRTELRFLLDRVLTDWHGLSEELGLDEAQARVSQEQASDLEQVRRQLLAFGMAAIALGQLPRLTAEQITFPYSYGQPATYADIDAPRSPGAMLQRIEEATQMLWQVMAGDAKQLIKRRYGPLRRTYGFFESSALLASHEAVRFGLKQKPRNLTLLS
jgi:hypothetical protein